MGHLFVIGELVGLSITAIDSTLIKANGHVWHKSSMKKGVVSRSGIDTDARWGYSYTKGWVFGYKLHLTSTTSVGDLIINSNSGCNHCQCARQQDVRYFEKKKSIIIIIIDIPFTSFASYGNLFRIR